MAGRGLRLSRRSTRPLSPRATTPSEAETGERRAQRHRRCGGRAEHLHPGERARIGRTTGGDWLPALPPEHQARVTDLPPVSAEDLALPASPGRMRLSPASAANQASPASIRVGCRTGTCHSVRPVQPVRPVNLHNSPSTFCEDGADSRLLDGSFLPDRQCPVQLVRQLADASVTLTWGQLVASNEVAIANSVDDC